MIVEKAARLCDTAKVPILGLVENFSYYICPHCTAKHSVMGESRAEEIARERGIATVAKLPISQKLSGAVDRGMAELFEGDWLDGLAERVLEGLEA